MSLLTINRPCVPNLPNNCDFRDVFQTMDDNSNKPRLACNPDFLLELVNGVYFGLFNGTPWPSLRGLDDIRQRAAYEMYPEVVLVTNAIVNSLLENPSGAPQEGPMGIRVAPSNFSISRVRGCSTVAQSVRDHCTKKSDQKCRRI